MFQFKTLGAVTMKIKISSQAHKKIMYWINKTEFEVSGFGLVEYDKQNQTFIVSDAFLLEQENRHTTTDIDAKSLGKLMFKHKDAAQAGKHLKFWWHSHVNMAAFWSGTDLDTIKELGKNGWIVASVFNKKNEYKSAACWITTSELGNSLSINDNITTIIGDELTPQEKLELDKEFSDNVKETTYQPQYATPKWNKDYSSYWDKDDYFSKWDKEEKAQKSKKETKSEYYTYGLFGYGAEVESKIVKMSPAAYVKTLLSGSDKEIDSIEIQLMIAERDGTLMKAASR